MKGTSVQMMVSLGVHSELWRVISIALKRIHEQRNWDKIQTKKTNAEFSTALRECAVQTAWPPAKQMLERRDMERMSMQGEECTRMSYSCAPSELLQAKVCLISLDIADWVRDGLISS